MLKQRHARRIVLVLVTVVALGGVAATIVAPSQGFPTPDSEICTTPTSDLAGEAPFLAENGAAMKKMMGDMAVRPTGDVDTDFVAMMVPHHQGAIDMALAVLRHSRNPQIRRLAQEIIVTQQQEIAVMRLAVGEPLPPSRPSPTKPSSARQNDSIQPIARAMEP